MATIIDDFESGIKKLPWLSTWTITKDGGANNSLSKLKPPYYSASISEFSICCNYISFYYILMGNSAQSISFKFYIDDVIKINTVIPYATAWNHFSTFLTPGNHKFTFNKAGRDMGIDEVIISNNYLLIQDKNNLCNTDGSGLTIEDSLPYTKDKFINYGMNNLSNINPTIINKINNQKYNIGLLR